MANPRWRLIKQLKTMLLIQGDLLIQTPSTNFINLIPYVEFIIGLHVTPQYSSVEQRVSFSPPLLFRPPSFLPQLS